MNLDPLLLEWLGTLLRWAHVVAAIMWIGDSFLFMWLDATLERASRPREGDVVGEIHLVHSGGFYEVVKRRSLRPEDLPTNLYAFKWQAYTTWISGICLMAVVYWLGGGALLVESGSRLTHGGAVAVSIGMLVAGWLVYDLACRSPLMKHPRVLAAVLSVVLAATAWGLTQVFGARAAWLQTGAMIATCMAANVFTVIVPGQKAMLAQTRAGLPVDTSHGVRAKVRSTHNHYLTLPVLCMMLSSHFPSGYGHPLSWVVLLLMTVVGVVIKYVMNARSRSDWRAVGIGVLALLATVAMTLRPGRGGASPATAATFAVSDEQALAIVERRCVTCHAEHPSNPSFPEPPVGVMLDRLDRLRERAPRVQVRAIDTRTMPLGNLTGMTDAERDTLAAWLATQRTRH